jgi:hypothetical protein
MSDAPIITNVWIYNIAVLQDEPYILLARRINNENSFWHLTCGGITMPVGQPAPTIAYFLREAQVAIRREANLVADQSKFFMLYYDDTPDSSWKPDVGCAHVLADHGRFEKALPEPQAQTVKINGGARSLVDNSAKWVLLSQLQISSTPQTDVKDAASRHVSYEGLPLRSTVSNTIKLHVMPYIETRYGPLRPLPVWGNDAQYKAVL